MTTEEREALRRSIFDAMVESVEERLISADPDVMCRWRSVPTIREWEGDEVVGDCHEAFRRFRRWAKSAGTKFALQARRLTDDRR